MGNEGLPRLYGDLAWLWPRLSPVGDYAAEAAALEALMHEHLGAGPHRVLELGAGGGHTLVHLSDRGGGVHDCEAADLSGAMLEHCRALLPGVPTHEADMRTLRLGRRFDVVLIHDAVDYLLTEADVAATLNTAAAHLRPGGLLLVAPTYTAETFEDGEIAADEAASPRQDRPGEPEVSYVTFVHDPDSGDGRFEMVLLYLMRDAATREVTVIEDRHVCGLFPEATWERLIAGAGLRLESGPAGTADAGPGDIASWSMFVARQSD